MLYDVCGGAWQDERACTDDEWREALSRLFARCVMQAHAVAFSVGHLEGGRHDLIFAIRAIDVSSVLCTEEDDDIAGEDECRTVGKWATLSRCACSLLICESASPRSLPIISRSWP